MSAARDGGTHTTRPKRVWMTKDSTTKGWHARFRFGRLQVGWHVYRHRYPVSSDRWVFHPEVVYDRA